MSLDNSWFTEPVDQTGTAFSLKLGERVHAEQTLYQKIEIYRTETFGYLMTIDGCTMVSTRDNFLYHEMMSHPALNSHPSPRETDTWPFRRRGYRHPGAACADRIMRCRGRAMPNARTAAR